MTWLSDRFTENNSKLAFGVIAGGVIYVLQNPSVLQTGGLAFWGPFFGGLLSQIVHILLPAENVVTIPLSPAGGAPAAASEAQSSQGIPTP